MRLFIFSLLSGLFWLSPVIATEDEARALRQNLQTLFPDISIDAVNTSPLAGLYQVVAGTEVFYVDRDAHYLLQGELLDLRAQRNLSEAARTTIRKSFLQTLKDSDYIEFAATPPIDEDRAVYVFTDVDCGYCRKLHRDVPELNRRGITVRYLAYPRGGLDSSTGKTMEAVWCASDRQAALSAAKSNRAFKRKQCDTSVALQKQLGERLGIRGTPAIYLQDGSILPGYMPPEKLLERIN